MDPKERNLSSKSLSDLSESLGEEIHEEKVTHLDLSSNRLASLPSSVSRVFSNLLKLDVSSNGLTELPVEFCELHRLQILHAKHNRMKSLPKNFGKLVGLMELNLSGNGFEHFPLQLCALDGLEYLHLGGNHITWITPLIKRLKRCVF